MLVLLRDELVPWFPHMLFQDAVKVWVEVDRILLQVRVQVVRPHHLRNPDQLVEVIRALEERLLAEDLSRVRAVRDAPGRGVRGRARRGRLTMPATMQPRLHRSSE